MFDYYAMPANTPHIENNNQDIFRRIADIEAAINQDIGMYNCYFHFMLHEFEGILFSNPASFALIAGNETVAAIQAIREAYPSPEHINQSPETAPSKRLEHLIPNYAKVKNGTILATDMGIDVILQNCHHFNEWISQIVQLASN